MLHSNEGEDVILPWHVALVVSYACSKRAEGFSLCAASSKKVVPMSVYHNAELKPVRVSELSLSLTTSERRPSLTKTHTDIVLGMDSLCRSLDERVFHHVLQVLTFGDAPHNEQSFKTDVILVT